MLKVIRAVEREGGGKIEDSALFLGEGLWTGGLSILNRVFRTGLTENVTYKQTLKELKEFIKLIS